MKHWVLAVAWSLVLVLPAVAFDFSAWDALLKKHVAPKIISGIRVHAVAYSKLKQDPQFKTLLAELENFDPAQLKTREQKLSFWINVYNIMAVKMVLDHYPIKSIKDVGNLLGRVGKLFPQMEHLSGSLFPQVWTMTVGVVGNKKRTLNEIEHKILRKMDEPRIHVAIVCASVSCPDLRQEAFTPERLDIQLDEQMEKFLQRPDKGMRIEPKEGRLYLSPIFKWFGEDFESRGGVIPFIMNFLSPDDREILQTRKLKISYLKYNWDLNDL